MVLVNCVGFEGFSSGDILDEAAAGACTGADGGGTAARTDLEERLILSSSML
jgi:hypothetical protein